MFSAGFHQPTSGVAAMISPIHFSLIRRAVLRSLVLVVGAAGVASTEHTNAAAPRESEANKSGNLDRAAWVTTDRSSYQVGGLIFVTLHNSTSTAIHAPPVDPAYCSMVSVQKWEVGGWSTQGSCSATGTKDFISLVPNSLMTAALIRAPSVAGPGGPYFGKPASPGVLEGNLQTLPAKPWKPGDLVTVVPEGDINVVGFLLGTRDVELSPGTYRVVFSFTRGSRAGAVETVHSEAFIVR